MPKTFPTDLRQFIQEELQTGSYADEDAVLTAALEVFREVRQRHTLLRARVQQSLTEAQGGAATPLDVEALKRSLINRVHQQKD